MTVHFLQIVVMPINLLESNHAVVLTTKYFDKKNFGSTNIIKSIITFGRDHFIDIGRAVVSKTYLSAVLSSSCGSSTGAICS